MARMKGQPIRPLRSEADYEAALAAIEHYFEREPKPGPPDADRFDLLALVIEDYQKKRWPIEPPDPAEALIRPPAAAIRLPPNEPAQATRGLPAHAAWKGTKMPSSARGHQGHVGHLRPSRPVSCPRSREGNQGKQGN